MVRMRLSGCWGRMSRHFGYCEKRPRPGKLTCWHHRKQERAAQILKEKLIAVTLKMYEESHP